MPRKTIVLNDIELEPANFMSSSNVQSTEASKRFFDSIDGKKEYFYLYSMFDYATMVKYMEKSNIEKAQTVNSFEDVPVVEVSPTQITTKISNILAGYKEIHEHVIVSFYSIAECVSNMNSRRSYADSSGIIHNLFGEKLTKIYRMCGKDVGCLIGNTLIFPMRWEYLFKDNQHTLKSESFTLSEIRRMFYEKLTGIKITATKQKIDTKVTIGADPEFLLYHTKKVGNELVPDYKADRKSVKDVINKGNRAQGSPIGVDGALGEFRPRYGKTVDELMDNLTVCIRSLERSISASDTPNAHLQFGGGFNASIGGHIHFGNKILPKLLDRDKLGQLGMALDDFLYYPMKVNMPGAMRHWSSHDAIKKKVTFDGYDGIQTSYIDPCHKIQEKAKDAVAPGKKLRYYHYETPQAFRGQPHGIEYRSLPSFIVSEDFSRLVFKISKGITEKFLSCINGTGYSYNDPPEREDYTAFITDEEYTTWMSYMEGDKKNSFIEDGRSCWGVRGNIDSNLMIFDSATELGDENDYKRFEFDERTLDKLDPIAKEIISLSDELTAPLRLKVTCGEYFMSYCTVPMMACKKGIFGDTEQSPEFKELLRGHPMPWTDMRAYLMPASRKDGIHSYRKLAGLYCRMLENLSSAYLNTEQHEKIRGLLKQTLPTYLNHFKGYVFEGYSVPIKEAPQERVRAIPGRLTVEGFINDSPTLARIPTNAVRHLEIDASMPSHEETEYSNFVEEDEDIELEIE